MKPTKMFGVIFSLILTVTLMAACSKAKRETAEQPTNDGFHKHYQGELAGKYAIDMNLDRAGNRLSGSYHYQGRSSTLTLSGTMDAQGLFDMSETDAAGTVTGKFAGAMKNARDETRLTGTWRKPNSQQTLAFYAWEIVPSPTPVPVVGTRQEILKKAAGDYPLQSINGNEAANAMFDTAWNDGRWTTSYSSIEAGTRTESDEVKLTADDLKLLNSMKLRVAPDQSVLLLKGDTEILRVPFSDTGLYYHVTGKYESVIYDDFLEKYKPSLDRKDAWLYLAAMDKIDLSKDLKAGFEMILGDMLTLRYSPASGAFEMAVFHSNCCDANIFTFKKHP